MNDPSPSEVRRRLVVSGRVQGVFFRASTRDRARRLGLRGWVRNEASGDVAICVAGPAAQVQALVDWCHQGPPAARVTGVDVADDAGDAPLPAPFDIRYGG